MGTPENWLPSGKNITTSTMRSCHLFILLPTPFLFSLLYSFLYKQESLLPNLWDKHRHFPRNVLPLTRVTFLLLQLSESNNSLAIFRSVFYWTVPKVCVRQIDATVQKMMHWYVRKINIYFNIYFFFKLPCARFLT